MNLVSLYFLQISSWRKNRQLSLSIGRLMMDFRDILKVLSQSSSLRLMLPFDSLYVPAQYLQLLFLLSLSLPFFFHGRIQWVDLHPKFAPLSWTVFPAQNMIGVLQMLFVAFFFEVFLAQIAACVFGLWFGDCLLTWDLVHFLAKSDLSIIAVLVIGKLFFEIIRIVWIFNKDRVSLWHPL